MAKNRNGIVKTEQLARRLGFRPLNTNKSVLLSDVIAKTITLKNQISKYISSNRDSLIKDYYKFVANYKIFTDEKYTRLNDRVIAFSAKEVQDIFQEIATAYVNQYDQQISDFNPKIQTGWERTTYVKGKKKGTTKTWTLKITKTDICRLVQFVVYFPPERWDSLKEHGKAKTLETLETIQNHRHKERIINTACRIRELLKIKLKTGIYTTGTHRKYFSTTGKDKLCEIIKDESNKENQWWLKLYFGKKADGNVVHLPIALNLKYFNPAKLDNKGSFLIKEQSKGKFVFIFTEEKETILNKEEEITFLNTAGIDVNATGDILSTTEPEANQTLNVDWFNKKLNIIFKEEKEKNKRVKNNQDYSLPLRRMNNAISSIEMVVKSHISKMLDKMEEKGIKHLSIEDLTLFDTKASFVKIEQFENIKISKLVRKLRLSNVGTWIEGKAGKRGIKVHRVPAAYSSQRCPYCGHIDRENRQEKEIFHCQSCKHINQADENAALNLKLITVVGVLRSALLKLDKSGRFVPKSNKKDFVKEQLDKSGFSLFASRLNKKASGNCSGFLETPPIAA